MIEKRNKIKALFSDLLNILNENDLWYAVDGTTLLGTVRHGGFVPWEEKLQITMTPADYRILQNVAYKNIVDSSKNKAIKKLSGFFIEDATKPFEEQPFIEIRILVPTTVKKLKNYRSLKHSISNFLKRRRFDTKTSINDLLDVRFEGFIPLESRKQDIKKSWIQVYSYKTVKKMFNGLEVNVPVEYKRILTDWYGDNFMVAKVPDVVYDYKSPIITEKESI